MNKPNSSAQFGPGLKPLWRQLQFALVLTTLVPLLALSYLILRYVEPAILPTGYIVVFLFIVMILVLTGTRMIFQMIARAVEIAAQSTIKDAAARLQAVKSQLRRNGHSIRHTVANATALMGAIPILVLGYVTVRYVVPSSTVENVLLLTTLVSVFLLLGMTQIYQLTNRIIAVAGEARLVRMEAAVRKRDYTVDEIGELSSDLSKISTKLSKRASELEHTRAFLSHLVERLPHPLLVVNSFRKINLVNPAAAKLLGYDSDELMGMDIASLFPGREGAEKLLESTIESARETVWLTKNGTRVPVLICSASLLENDVERGLVLIGMDITERKRMDEELKVTQKYARNLIDSSLDMIVSVDQERRIVEFNLAAQKEFGYSKGEVLGKHVDILYADPAQGMNVHKKTKETGRFSGEVVNKRKNGELFNSFLSASALKDENGEFLGVMGVSRDITERKRIEETLKARTDRLERFHKVSVGRELEMVKLKEELSSLLEKLGQPKKYNV